MKPQATPAFLRTLGSTSSIVSRSFLNSCHGFPPAQQTRCIRSVMNPPILSRFDRAPDLPKQGATQEAARQRRLRTMPLRTGVLGSKKGMSAVYDADTGVRTPVTVVQMDRVQVIGHKTLAKHGYYAVQVGHQAPKRETRAMRGVFQRAGTPLKREIVEFMVKDESGLVPVGTILQPDWFAAGEYVDAKSNCKGKGFAGGMKRHGMAGQPASHGVSLTHRSLGSAGQSQGGGSRVYPGKRMPGRMGGQQVTVFGCKVVQVDNENGLLVLHGCIAGPNGTTIKLQDSRKHSWPDRPGIPAELLAQETSTPETTATA